MYYLISYYHSQYLCENFRFYSSGLNTPFIPSIPPNNDWKALLPSDTFQPNDLEANLLSDTFQPNDLEAKLPFDASQTDDLEANLPSDASQTDDLEASETSVASQMLDRKATEGSNASQPCGWKEIVASTRKKTWILREMRLKHSLYICTSLKSLLQVWLEC
jgi:hypothetical protein